MTNQEEEYGPFVGSENSNVYHATTTISWSDSIDTTPNVSVEEDAPSPAISEEHIEDVDAYIEAVTSTDPDVVNVDEEFDRLVNDAQQSENTPDAPNETSVDTPMEEEEDKKNLLSLRQLNESFLEESRTARFSSAVWYKRAQMLEVTVIGAGGIGSWAAVLIARLGVVIDLTLVKSNIL